MKGYWLLPGFLSAFWLSTAVQAATIEDEYIHPVRYQPHVTTDGERVIMPAPKPQVMSGIRTTLPVLVAQAVGAIAPIVDRTVDRVEVPPNKGRLLDGLQQRVTSLWSKFPSLRSYDAGVFVLDLNNGNYLNLHGDKVFPTASIIKLPILIAFLQDVDAGKVSLDETLVMTRDVIVGGSGELQDLPPGSKFTVLQTLNKMITISDNTATNMIIKPTFRT